MIRRADVEQRNMAPSGALVRAGEGEEAATFVYGDEE